MANQIKFLQGKAKWFKALSLNKFGNWSHDIYLTPESVDIVRDLKETKGETTGILNMLRQDEDGFFMSINKKPNRVVKGKLIAYPAPDILDRDGQPMPGVNVGNGSDITTKIRVYKYKKPLGSFGTAIEWVSTKVDNLVPFETQRDYSEMEQRVVRGLEDQTPQPMF